MPNSGTKTDSTRSNSLTPRRPRKRRRCELQSLDSQVDEDAKEIDRRLRKVAKDNSISSEDMHKVVRSVVRNDHVLALVTLKAEDELAREKKLEPADQHKRGAIIITDTPSVPKLTRAKARELNCASGISLASLNETPTEADGIEALIRADLHSDEDDEEYTFKEDDFNSDDDHNTTASDFDSNPCTPQTPITAAEESPVKFSEDGCFKLPFDKNLMDNEDLRIATRTRSKLCLQQTTIEDLQSEFVPPDLEPSDVGENEMTANDADWMQFLNDFTKPLNNTLLGDDDDPINDPEYVAADHLEYEYENAEELRDANISKKELTDLVSELFAGLLQEGVSLESVELETPQKFLESANVSVNPIEQVSRQIDFDGQVVINGHQEELQVFQQSSLATSCNVSNMGMSIMPVPVAVMQEGNAEMGPGGTPCKVVNIPTDALSVPPELIAVPLPGQPNCFQLAKVVTNDSALLSASLMPEPIQDAPIEPIQASPATKNNADRYKKPYDTNFTWEYISVKKHVYAEYEEQFENLRNVQPVNNHHLSRSRGFTPSQHDMLQQQLRIHTQLLTQSYLQTYSHPTLYHLSTKPRGLLENLHRRANKDASFNCWNLKEAVQLVRQWEKDLCSDKFEEENTKMMEFINKETDLTDGHTRQVPRLAPRIMDLMLDSRVFMYPQYLPRMAFQPKLTQVTAYAPSEYQLIAMGLEKHMASIRSAKRPLRKGADPIRIACKRMVKDTVCEKTARRIFMKITELRGLEQYNPVKYYLDRERAPPVHNNILWGFEGGLVRTPRERYQELPSGWQYYIQKTWDEKRTRRPWKVAKASSEASISYLEFVREAVGEDLPLPENLGQAAVPDGSAAGSELPNDCKRKKTTAKRKSRPQEKPSQLTINVNYVFGGGADAGNLNAVSGVSVPFLSNGSLADNILNINRSLHTSAECSGLLALPPPPPPLDVDAPPAINYKVDELTHTLQITELENTVEDIQQDLLSTQEISGSSLSGRGSHKKARYQIFKPKIQSASKSKRGSTPTRSRYHKLRERLRHKLRKRCHSLITSYGSYLQKRRNKYIDCALVQRVHRYFLALELYTQLLVDLKMFCNTTTKPSTATQPKRSRADDEAAKIRKANRQEEILRQMLQPDTPEESNRKDSTFALNYYDKVEEALLNADRLEDCRKFNSLLQNFDPKVEKVSDLYLKVEKILLPDLPELAEVFLNFLLPAEAAEIGKFFEHFMICNATNFINKLNIFFCKQPAQIRKIYACLSELAELPNVSMKKVENKIMPLLKGNQFLCDWFVQQFPQGKPPKRILSPVETINMHDVQNNTTGEYTEMVQEFIDVPAPSKPACHIKYINGRIFYGAKILLPAKLSFMAASIHNEQDQDVAAVSSESLICAHGIRSQGEKLLSMAANADSDDAADRSEEDDASRALIIDTTGDEQNSCSSIEMCDEAGLRSHAIRLNASLYTNSSFSHAATSTPNVSHSHGHHHHPNAKKTAINFGEISPRKQSAFNNSGLSPLPAMANCSPHVDKRKSPSKKGRSPSNPNQGRQRSNNQPMVVIHESKPSSSPAIECAKRLRTLIDQESARDAADTKAGIRIIAQAKQTGTTPSPRCSPAAVTKVELESQEESGENVRVFTPLKMDLDQSEDEELEPMQVSGGTTPQHVITTQFDSDEDCKLDVVATLASCSPTEDQPATSADAASTSKDESVSSHSAPWTREEDKVILIEMKIGARDREQLIRRICAKLLHRSIGEIRGRHQFLMDFLSKLQGK